ncbi:unnamed protein product [Gadus morhua 'NCC']
MPCNHSVGSRLPTIKELSRLQPFLCQLFLFQLLSQLFLSLLFLFQLSLLVHPLALLSLLLLLVNQGKFTHHGLQAACYLP